MSYRDMPILFPTLPLNSQLQTRLIIPGFHMEAMDPHSGPYPCVEGT